MIHIITGNMISVGNMEDSFFMSLLIVFSVARARPSGVRTTPCRDFVPGTLGTGDGSELLEHNNFVQFLPNGSSWGLRCTVVICR